MVILGDRTAYDVDSDYAHYQRYESAQNQEMLLVVCAGLLVVTGFAGWVIGGWVRERFKNDRGRHFMGLLYGGAAGGVIGGLATLVTGWWGLVFLGALVSGVTAITRVSLKPKPYTPRTRRSRPRSTSQVVRCSMCRNPMPEVAREVGQVVRCPACGVYFRIED